MKAGGLKIANARLKTLIDLGLEFASERDPDRLLQRVCSAARDVLGATTVTLSVVDRDDRTVPRVFSCGADATRPTAPRLPARHPDVQAYLVAPLASAVEAYGWFRVVGHEGGTFSEDDEHLMVALSAQAGRIVENLVLSAIVQKRAEDLEREILERRQAEVALRHESDWAQRYLDTAQTMLIALDTSGRITLANRYACAVLGWPVAELLGRDWFDTCLPARTRDEWRQNFHAAIAGDLPVGENPVLTRSGEERLIEWRNTVLRDDAGGVAGTFSSGADITEGRALQERLQQAQKTEAIGRLAGGVAHDFNNLLTAILGYCELSLADLGPDDGRREDIVEIQKAGTSAARLTRQLLAFSRREIIQPTVFDLNVVVADLQGILGRLIREDVTVVLNLAPGLVPVQADRGQMEQVVMNLTINARDAMPEGGTMTIETASVDLDEHYARTHPSVTPGPYVVLTVTDTGTGMTPAVLARLFEPFFTTKAVGEGTGLGLATVHGIATRSGGSIDVRTAVGKGSTVKVYFPRADEADVVPEPPPRAARPQTGSETVLVVDDSRGLRELARRLLRRQGYTVLLAADADEARQMFDEHPSIDVLLTDVVMPGTSGPELSRRLASQRPGLKVLYMSGYTEQAIVHHGILDPGIEYLPKPFTAQALAAKIREVLDR